MGKNRVYTAHSGRDPRAYIEACMSQGLPIEDEFLLERFETDRTLGNPSYSYVAGLVRIIGKRFPEGNMNADTVRRRLGVLKKATDNKNPGYYVESHSKMRNDELFSYFKRTLAQIMGLGEMICPDVLSEVRHKNKTA